MTTKTVFNFPVWFQRARTQPQCRRWAAGCRGCTRRRCGCLWAACCWRCRPAGTVLWSRPPADGGRRCTECCVPQPPPHAGTIFCDNCDVKRQSGTTHRRELIELCWPSYRPLIKPFIIQNHIFIPSVFYRRESSEQATLWGRPKLIWEQPANFSFSLKPGLVLLCAGMWMDVRK